MTTAEPGVRRYESIAVFATVLRSRALLRALVAFFLFTVVELGTWVAILVYAVASRVLYLLAWAADPVSGYLLHDARRYDAWARALAGGLVFEPGPFYQAPLYPYFVSLVYRVAGPHPFAVYAVQALLVECQFS